MDLAETQQFQKELLIKAAELCNFHRWLRYKEKRRDIGSVAKIDMGRTTIPLAWTIEKW